MQILRTTLLTVDNAPEDSQTAGKCCTINPKYILPLRENERQSSLKVLSSFTLVGWGGK